MADAKKVLLALVVGFITVTSVIGFVFVNYGGSTSAISYNGHRFERQLDGSLVTRIDGKYVPFTYFPDEIKELLNQTATDRLKDTRMAYMTSDYYSNHSGTIASVQFDISKALLEHKGIFSVQGFLQNSTGLPVITCENATSFVPVILMQEGDSAIYEKGGCIVIQAESQDDFVRARDAVLYRLLGVTDGNRAG
ncbi:hypothetical protein HY640_03780 [Candidatus Woesearchaeota archaeon]|nr:hypothetical protein [Candidatus Woesearchaeota archaeon]